jgi:2-amino-4-hydroxy-6-hydroxymethyldihydropteridine diphosphokinase
MATIYLSLGSNLGDREANLREAIGRLNNLHLRVSATSAIYESEPVGDTRGAAPNYLNGVIRAETELSPEQVLDYIGAVEGAGGRLRPYRWAPRTIDIDLLLYDSLTMESERLTVPHPRMRDRAFVLVPLAEIAPDLAFPDGTTVSAALHDPSVAIQKIHRYDSNK